MGTQKNKTEKLVLLNQFLALCVLTTAMGIFLIGCGQPGSVVGTPRKAEEQPASVTLEIAKSDDRPILTKNVTVTESNLSDVIIVIDNSASMRIEQANMAERFSSLLEEMKELDWRLGIITTDVSRKDQPKKDGRFLEFPLFPGQEYLSSEMETEAVKTAFAATIQRPAREGHANEQGIKATYRALERKPEWLRANASLNVVVVTDADESPYKGHAEIRNNPSDLIKLVQSENPSKSFFFHSIIVKEGDEVCLKKDGNESYGRSYAWLSEKTGGVIGDVCQADYSKQLKMIGEKVSQKIKSVGLDCVVAPGSVLVKAGPDLITDFVLEGKELTFAQALPVGTTQIDYQCYE